MANLLSAIEEAMFGEMVAAMQSGRAESVEGQRADGGNRREQMMKLSSYKFQWAREGRHRIMMSSSGARDDGQLGLGPIASSLITEGQTSSAIIMYLHGTFPCRPMPILVDNHVPIAD